MSQEKRKDYSVSFVTDQDASSVWKAVNNVTAWWTENLKGASHSLDDEFEVQFGDVHYSKQRLVEVVPERRVIWLVTDCRLSFLKDKQEWTGTRVIFDILPEGKQTRLTFTHQGLLPEVECYDACSDAWRSYILGSLQQLVSKGAGTPAPRE